MNLSQQLQQPPRMIELPPFVRGDTWDGIFLIGPITFNGAPPPALLTGVLMHFRRNWSDFNPAYVLSSSPTEGQGQIVITSPDLWTLKIPSQPLPLAPRVWTFDIQFTDSLGVVFTPVGGTISVAKDYTR